MKKITEKDMDILFKNAKCKLISTSNGVAIEGDLIHILGSFSMLAVQMIDGGIPKDMVKHAFDVALDSVKDKKESKEDKDELKEILKETLSDFRDVLNEMLGDDK